MTDKDSHWHFFIPKGDGTQLHFRYPKLWEIGAISSIAERSMEGLVSGEPKKFAENFARVVMDQFKLDYVPQAIEPLYEQYLNKSRFTGAPIETQSMEQLSPFARSKPHTARVMKDLGMATRKNSRSLQASPARLEALLKGYLNTWAMYGLTMADAALYDDKPALRVDQYPVFRRFYAGTPAKRTKYETQFYDMLREATELRRTMRHMDKNLRPDIAEEISQRDEIADYPALQKTQQVLRTIKAEMNDIYDDPDMTPDHKRQRLDALIAEKNQLLEEAVTDIEADRKQRETL